jgi:hypothetical protein
VDFANWPWGEYKCNIRVRYYAHIRTSCLL